MDKQIIKRFLIISTLISLISTANFISSECNNFIISLNNLETVRSCKSSLTGKKHAYLNERYIRTNQTSVTNTAGKMNQLTVEKLYRIVLSLLVAANLFFTMGFYTLIVRYILLRKKTFATKFNSTVPRSYDKSIKNKRNSLVDFYLYLRHRTSLIVNPKNLKAEGLENDNSIVGKSGDKILPKLSDPDDQTMRLRKSHSLPLSALTSRDNYDEITYQPNTPVDSSITKLRLHQRKTSKFNTKHSHKKSTKLFLSVSI
jgi:hypothetical protein